MYFLTALAILSTSAPTQLQSATDTLRVATSEVRFSNGAVELQATLHLPMAAKPAPAVVIIHGSGSSDRTNPWTTAYVNALASAGIAVLHPDKRGSGKSSGRWQTASMEDLARDASAAVALLRSRGDIDRRRIGVIGFSQGGYVAAIVAAEDSSVAFTAVVSGGTASLAHQMVDEIALKAANGGDALKPDEENSVRAIYSSVFAFARSGAGWPTLRADIARLSAQSARMAAALGTLPQDSTHWAIAWVRQTGDFDPVPYWRRTAKPVFLVYGGRDANVRTRESIERLWNAVGADAKNFSIVMLQGNGHALYRDDVAAMLVAWIRG